MIAGLCVALACCDRNNPADKTPDIEQKGDTVTVSANSPVNSKIQLYTVAEQDFSKELTTTGVVRAISGQMAEIAPPFDGRVSRSFVKLGQRVGPGTPLFELHSAEFFEATKNYFQALQDKKMKQSNLSRQRDLVKNGVGVAKELEEAETDYEFALKEYENASALLRMFNVDPDKVTMGQPLKVVSPIAGEVVQADIVIGQYVKSDAAPLAVVAELSKVWVVAQLKERYIGAIRSDDKVEIRTDADPQRAIAGQVAHIGELLDEQTRSVRVLIACDNRDRTLRPGMFAEVRFTGRPAPSIVIPSAALLQDEGESYVFVRRADGVFVKRTVRTATASAHEALVLDGLTAGERIVSEGAVYLMAE